MKVQNYKSEWSEDLNASIMAAVEKVVCKYRNILPDGWRTCIEFQDDTESEPSYLLDLESNKGGGEFAPIKMQTLLHCPGVCATGTADLEAICDALRNLDPKKVEQPGLIKVLLERLAEYHEVVDITNKDWNDLRELGITKWYGGIRVPYDILWTKHNEVDDEQDIDEVRGEIRVTFSGAKEWQDVFFAFVIFKGVQKALKHEWKADQIWYNLRELGEDMTTKFWIKELKVKEVV